MASRPKPGQRARFTGASISESLSFAKTASDSVDGRPVMLVTGPAGDETGRAGVPGGAVGILERATEGDGAWRWDESELTKRERRAVVAGETAARHRWRMPILGADVARARDPHGRPRALPVLRQKLRPTPVGRHPRRSGDGEQLFRCSGRGRVVRVLVRPRKSVFARWDSWRPERGGWLFG